MLLTIFTPTYNRAHTIDRLYRSLCDQTCRDFEWLIVDDGSTDNTSAIVEQYQNQSDFSIRYYKKENGGKHTAYNFGLTLASGDLFFTVDSDDWLPADSVELISRYSAALMSNDRLAGIIALKSFANNDIIGKKYIADEAIMSLRQLELSGQGGERSLVFKTEIARQFPFPIIRGEKFMTESVVYDKYVCYDFLALNSALTICEYQQDGLSCNPKRVMLNNPGGYMLYFCNRIDTADSFAERFGYVLRYNVFRALYSGNEVSPYSGRHRMLVRLMRVFNPYITKRYYN